MIRKKLYLDIDDTVLDTENHLRRVLGGKWLNYNGLLYTAYDEMTSVELEKVFRVFSDYSKIPYILGAYDGLRILSTEYDVVFCSSYHTAMEKRAKEEWAKKLGIPIILCKGMSKDKVNMEGAILIDDNSYNLIRCNASEKICFYKNHSFVEAVDSKVIFDWFELIDELC